MRYLWVLNGFIWIISFILCFQEFTNEGRFNTRWGVLQGDAARDGLITLGALVILFSISSARETYLLYREIKEKRKNDN